MEPFENLMYLFSSCVENRGIVRLNLKEAALLYKTAKNSKHTVVEIGRKYGGSALLLASAVQDGIKVVSIDIKNHKYLDHNLSLAPKDVKDKLDIIKGSSYDVAKKWDQPIGLVFIDGDHSVEGLKQDVKCWTPFLVSGGFAVFHDIVDAGIGLEVVTDKLQKEGWKFVASADTMLVLEKP